MVLSCHSELLKLVLRNAATSRHPISVALIRCVVVAFALNSHHVVPEDGFAMPR